MLLSDIFPGSVVETKVSIVGAGIIGCFLALKLAKNGIACVLIEAKPRPKPLAKAQGSDIFQQTQRVVALTRASENRLKELDCWQSIATENRSAYQAMQVWARRGLGEFTVDASEVNQPNLGHIVYNQAICGALLQQLADQALVSILWDTQVIGIDSTPQQTRLTLDTGAHLTSELCVAADGAHSPLKSLLAINSKQSSYRQKAIVATLEMEQAHNNTAYQNFLESGPLAFLPLSTPNHGSIVWSADDSESDALMALDYSAFASRVASALDMRLGFVKNLSPRMQFPLVARQSEQYYHHSCVLVGDAAHTIHPLAGQGVNLGFEDAELLAQLLVAANQQQLPLNQATMLQRYQRHRRSEAQNMLLAMQGFKQCFGYQQPWWVAARSLGMGMLNSSTALKRYLVKQALAI